MRARVNSGEKEDLYTLWGYNEVTAIYARCCTGCPPLYNQT